MPPKIEKNVPRSIFYYLEGQKFDRNLSSSYSFREICDFLFSTKIQDDRQKLKKIENFYMYQEASSTTLWVKNSIEIAVALTVFEIFAIFCFSQKFKMAAKN